MKEIAVKCQDVDLLTERQDNLRIMRILKIKISRQKGKVGYTR